MFGLLLLFSSGNEIEEPNEIIIADDAEVFDDVETNKLISDSIEFDDVEDAEDPITTTPNPINMGQVVLGREEAHRNI